MKKVISFAKNNIKNLACIGGGLAILAKGIIGSFGKETPSITDEDDCEIDEIDENEEQPSDAPEEATEE